MPRNIEIKLQVDSIEPLRARARALADGEPLLIEQDDSFYAVSHGRLKLRRLREAGGPWRAELIPYSRADEASGGAARASHYQRVPVPDPDALHAALATACGVTARVRKQRWLLQRGATRIHLDRVEGYGDAVEIEVVMTEERSDADGQAEAEALVQALGLRHAPRIAGAYADLIAAAA